MMHLCTLPLGIGYLAAIASLNTFVKADLVKVGGAGPIIGNKGSGTGNGIISSTAMTAETSDMGDAFQSGITEYETDIETETVVVTRLVEANECGLLNAPNCSVVELCVRGSLTFADFQAIKTELNDLICESPGCTAEHPMHFLDYYTTGTANKSMSTIVGTVCEDACQQAVLNLTYSGIAQCALNSTSVAGFEYCGITLPDPSGSLTPLGPGPEPALPSDCMALSTWYNPTSGAFEWVCAVCSPNFISEGLMCTPFACDTVNVTSDCASASFCAYENLFCENTFTGPVITVCLPTLCPCPQSPLFGNNWNGLLPCPPCDNGSDEQDSCENVVCGVGLTISGDEQCDDAICANCCRKILCDDDVTCPTGSARTGVLECTSESCEECCIGTPSENLCRGNPIPDPFLTRTELVFCRDDLGNISPGNCDRCFRKITCREDANCGPGSVRIAEQIDESCQDEDCTQCCDQLLCADVDCDDPDSVQTGETECTSDSCANCCKDISCSANTCPPGFDRTGEDTCDSVDDCTNCCVLAKTCVEDADCAAGFTETALVECLDVSCDGCCEQLTCAPITCDDGFEKTAAVNCTNDECTNCCRALLCSGHECPAGQEKNADITTCDTDECTECCTQLVCDPSTCSGGEAATGDLNCTDDDCTNCCEQLTCATDGFCGEGKVRNSEVEDCSTLSCVNCCTQLTCDAYECPPNFVPIPGQGDCTTDNCDNCCRPKLCSNNPCNVPGEGPSGDERCEEDGCDNCCVQRKCADESCNPGFEQTSDEDCVDDDCSNCCVRRTCAVQISECAPGFVSTGATDCTNNACSNCCRQLVCGSHECVPGEMVTSATVCDDDECTNCCRQRSCTEVRPCRDGFEQTPREDCNTDSCANCCKPLLCSEFECEAGEERTDQEQCADDDCNGCCRQLTCNADDACRTDEYETGDENCSSDNCSNCCELEDCSSRTCGPGLVRSGDETFSDSQGTNCCEQLLCADTTCGAGIIRKDDTECTTDSCANCCVQRVCADVECDATEVESVDELCTVDSCSNCCVPDRCSEFRCPSGQRDTDQRFCINGDCSGCCEQLECDADVTCTDSQRESGDTDCDDNRCSNCCDDLVCSVERPCVSGEEKNGHDDTLCDDSTCANCCTQLTCDPVCDAGKERTTDTDCEDSDCSNCCRQLTCATDNVCGPGQEERVNQNNCDDDACSNCCEQLVCADVNCAERGAGIEADDSNSNSDCANLQCTNCCQFKTCDDDNTCAPTEKRTAATNCDTQGCANCCTAKTCSADRVCDSDQGEYAVPGVSTCTDANCDNCCEVRTCDADSCDPGLVFDNTQTFCTDRNCGNCCTQLVCDDVTCLGVQVKSGNQNCRNDGCTNCCVDQLCSNVDCDDGSIESGDTDCDVQSCDNCCTQQTCAVAFPTCPDGTRSSGEDNCQTDDCSDCCVAVACTSDLANTLGGDCGAGLGPSGDRLCSEAAPDLCTNCCKQLVCGTDSDDCDTDNGEVEAFPGGTPCDRDNCAKCCRQKTCADDGNTCTPGQRFFADDDCEDASCSNCCEDRLCDPDDCTGDQLPSGDATCTDADCENCCVTCGDDVISGTEQCEYFSAIDKWLVPEASEFSVDCELPNEPQYTGLSCLQSNRQCDSGTCQVIVCRELKEYQRVCAATTGEVKTDFEDMELVVPLFNRAITNADLIAIDLATTGQISGSLMIQNTQEDNQNSYTAIYQARTTITVPNTEVEIVVIPRQVDSDVPLAPGENITDVYFVTDTFLSSSPFEEKDNFSNDGSDTFILHTDAVGMAEIQGLNILSDITTSIEVIVQIRYLYEWCPPPGVRASNRVENEDDTCTDDTESVPDWAVLRCGDGLASPDLNEECDGTRGTNDTFYCNDDCKLVENECGDGVLYGDEECENIFGDDEFKDDSVDPSNNRCRKPGDDGEACTVQATVCGDGVKTDNEECETNPDGSGDIRTRNDDDYSIGPNDSDDDNYCDANCELQPIRNCRAISTSRCVCSSGTFTRTYTRTREKTPRGADCDDSNGNAITFDSDDMATITDDGICVCECGNGVVDTGNGEECDEGQDAVLSSTEVCRHCEIVEQECGDGTVDTIRNEQCDPPFSEGGQISSVNGNVQYCRDNCRTAAAGECEFTIAQGKCQCTIDSPIQGTRQVRTVIDQQEEPQGYMGGCPEEETVTEDCECESCVGQWQDYNFADGRPRCQFDGTDCLQKERFVRVSGDGSICENQDTSGEFFRINSHRDIAGPNGCTANGACVACEENYKKKQCNVLCGTGSEVGFYTITTQPGYASTAGRQGSELQCECREEGDACTSDTWVELPDSECGVDGSNSNNPCTCEGNEQKARFVRECTYEVDFPTALGLPFVDLDIAKFYRPPNQNTFEDGFPVDQSSLQYNLKAIETTAKFDLEGRIRVVNEEVSGVRYTATFRDPEITVAVKSGGAQLVASKYGDQSEYSVIQAGATKNFIFDYPTQTHTSSVTQGLNQITTNSESDERLRFTVDGDAIGTVTGGGNQINEISGSYGVKLVAKFEYEGCDLGDAYEASQYSECDADTKSS